VLFQDRRLSIAFLTRPAHQTLPSISQKSDSTAPDFNFCVLKSPGLNCGEPQLATGEYALVEIISASEMNQTVWEFRVDPASEDNPGSIGPILQERTGNRN
jgi:hypothetical protein